MIIDAHVHVWNLAAGGYDWPNASVPALHRNFSVNDLEPTLDRLGVSGIVLVQAADTTIDTANMFAEAARSPHVRGVIAWTDLAAESETFARELACLREQDAFRGLRNLSHIKADKHWIRGSNQQANIAQLATHGVPLDMVTSNHDELDEVCFTLENVPNITVVLDHLGKPPIRGSAASRTEWAARMRDIASSNRVSAKISGLSAEVRTPDTWTSAHALPYLEDALEIFGPNRLMYGGDWPVSLLAGGYQKTWDTVTTALQALDSRSRAAIWGETATRVYSL